MAPQGEGVENSKEQTTKYYNPFPITQKVPCMLLLELKDDL
jgi:hypothetical protein